MNKFIGMGRLTADPETKYNTGQNNTIVSRYTLAINRRNDGADFIPCVAFGKSAEFAGKYFKKGMQILVVGKLQINTYTDKDGVRRSATSILIDEQYFTESKKQAQESAQKATWERDGFYVIDDDSELPF